MRVISGTMARRKLQSPPGFDVRPTTDRIKETLFNILAPRIYGTDFLDLFAGSGQIGIEALSRGSESVVFVDDGKTSNDYIKKNLEMFTGTDAKFEVYRMSAVPAISRLRSFGKKFDIIFMDPPYDKEIERDVLMELDRNRILKEDGLIIVEASSKTDFNYIEDTCFEITREKNYGTNKHIFIAYK